MAVTDESPAHLGGKDNTWRRMNHDSTWPLCREKAQLIAAQTSTAKAVPPTLLPSLPLIPSLPRSRLSVLPRHSFMHSIVELLTSSCLLTEGRSLDRLQGLLRPPTQSEQIKYIKTVSSLRYVDGL